MQIKKKTIEDEQEKGRRMSGRKMQEGNNKMKKRK
jgi:hypothetical protein